MTKHIIGGKGIPIAYKCLLAENEDSSFVNNLAVTYALWHLINVVKLCLQLSHLERCFRYACTCDACSI